MRPMVVLVNPSAGSVDGSDDLPAGPTDRAALPAGPIADALAALAESADVAVVVVAADTDITAAAEGLEEEGVLVVAGGDGTLHRTLNALPDRRGAVLLIPAGTGNDFAGGLDLPEDLVESARASAAGSPQPMDVIEVGDVLAVNAAHLGVGVDAAEAASDLKGALGKLAYPAGAIAAAARFEPTRVTVRLDGEVVVDDEDIAMLAVCNGSTVGGGTPLCPAAEPGDGVLDLVVLRAVTGPALAATAAALLRGRHLDRDDVAHHRGEVVEVVVHDAVRDGRLVTWNVDGELLERPAALTCRIRPAAWQLLGPPPSLRSEV
jgi:diacylglycerol kinase (ATP)